MKTARLKHPRVEVAEHLEIGLFDGVADATIVRHPPIPVDLPIGWQSCFGKSCDNPRLVIPAIEQLVGHTVERLHADAGYRGHNAPPDYKFKVDTSKQKRRVTPQIKREMRRRSAVEPVIGHLKEDHRMGRNYLAHRHGDFNNAVLAGVGYNFRRLICWLRFLLHLFLAILLPPTAARPA